MDYLVFLGGYGLAWWLGWSTSVLVQQRQRQPRWRLWLMGLLHGFLFSLVIGLLLLPPAMWPGYVVAGVALFQLFSGMWNIKAGLTFFGKPHNNSEIGSKPKSASPVLAPKPNAQQVAQAKAEHDKAAADMAAQRAAWETDNLRQPKLRPTPAAVVPAASPVEPDSLDTLRRMCQDMTSDGSLDEEEIYDLKLWLDTHPGVVYTGLAGRLADYIDVVLADGEITLDEAFDVFDLAEAVALGKTEADLADWKPLAPLLAELDQPKPRRRKPPATPRTSRKGKLDTIRFAYVASGGELTQRRVVVHQLDGEYFQGRCLMRNATRTFRLDRVIGDVTSEDSGEVVSAFEWAAGLLHSPAPVVPDTCTTPAHPMGGKEVLITGFAAAERARLEQMAIEAGMTLRKSVTQNLDFLVAGPRAGPSKLAKAQLQLVVVLTGSEFEAMVVAS